MLAYHSFMCILVRLLPCDVCEVFSCEADRRQEGRT